MNSKYFKQGEEAFHIGFRIDNNPYSEVFKTSIRSTSMFCELVSMYTEWNKGFLYAQNEQDGLMVLMEKLYLELKKKQDAETFKEILDRMEECDSDSDYLRQCVSIAYEDRINKTNIDSQLSGSSSILAKNLSKKEIGE